MLNPTSGDVQAAADRVTGVVRPLTVIAAAALRACGTALAWARAADVRSIVVDDPAIIATRRLLWDRHRIAVEHGAATGLAAVRAGGYRPHRGERIAFVLCGANTDPADLMSAV